MAADAADAATLRWGEDEIAWGESHGSQSSTKSCRRSLIGFVVSV